MLSCRLPTYSPRHVPTLAFVSHTAARRPFTASTPARYPRVRPGVRSRPAGPSIDELTDDGRVTDGGGFGLEAMSGPRVNQRPKDLSLDDDKPFYPLSATTSASVDSFAQASVKTSSKAKARKTRPPPVLSSAHDMWRAKSISFKTPPVDDPFTSGFDPRNSKPKGRRGSNNQPPPAPSTPKASPSSSLLDISLSSTSPTTSADSFFTSTNPTFLYSATHLRTTPPNSALPELAIIGASNVGKSTFLNGLVGRSSSPSFTSSSSPSAAKSLDLARTSARAGHTRTMNAYGVGPAPTGDLARLRKRMRGGGSDPGSNTKNDNNSSSSSSAGGPAEKLPSHSLVLVDTPGYGFKSQREWGQGVVGYLGRRTMLRGVVVLVAAEKGDGSGGLGAQDAHVLRMVAGLGRKVLVVVTKGDRLLRGKKGKKKGVSGNEDEVGGLELHETAMARLQGVEAAARRALGGRGGQGWQGISTVAGGAGEGEGDSLVFPRVYLTAADMPRSKKKGGDEWRVDSRGANRGMGGVRAAILELAGIAEPESSSKDTKEEEQDEKERSGGTEAVVADYEIPPERRSQESDPEAWSGEMVSYEELEKMYGRGTK